MIQRTAAKRKSFLDVLDFYAVKRRNLDNLSGSFVY